MKKMTIFAAAAGLFFLTAGITETNAQELGTLTVKVEGLRSNDGKVMLAIMNDDMTAKDWSKFDPTNMDWSSLIVYATMEDSSTRGTEFEVKDLPEGKRLFVYIMHDENGNHMMDFDERMMPREGFVRGNGEIIPSVTITGEDHKMTVSMTYL